MKVTVTLIILLIILADVIDDFTLGYVIANTPSVLGIMPWWYLVAFIGGIILSIIHKSFTKENANALKKHYKPFMLHMVASVVGATCWFLAIKYIGISGIAIVSNFNFFIVILYGLFVFHERLTSKQIVAALIMFLGMILFLYSPNEATRLGIILGIVVLIETSLTKIIKKHIANTVPGEILVTLRAFSIMVVISILMVILQIPFFVPKDPFIVLCIVAGGITGPILYQYISLVALKKLDLSIFTLLTLTSPVLIFFTGIYVLGEPFTIYKALGGVFVLIGAIIILPHINPKFKHSLHRKVHHVHHKN